MKILCDQPTPHMAETSLESETLNLLFGVLVSTFQKTLPL